MIEKIFTEHLPQPHLQNWMNSLLHLKDKPNLRFMEIGVYEGRSTCWFMDNILTDPTSTLLAIDPFGGSKTLSEEPEYWRQVQENFKNNTAEYADRVRLLALQSQVVLPTLVESFSEHFDFIYIDGSHEACDVLFDAVLCWKLLKPGGVMIFDDYLWDATPTEVERPKIAVDSFLACFEGKYDKIFQSWQYAIRKL